MKKADPWQLNKIHNILLTRGLIDDKKSYIRDFTGGREESSIAMSYQEAMNLINHFNPQQAVRYVETTKAIKLRKDVFGFMRQLHAAAPQLGILVDDKWNQTWIKKFFLDTIGKEDIYTMNEAERLQCYVKIKQILAGYTKKAVKEAKNELDDELDYHLSH